MMISTTQGEIDEALLQKKEAVVDNEDEYTTAVEYCLADCPGIAHSTKQPDSISHFCNLHVHRSVHVTLKKLPAASGIAASF